MAESPDKKDTTFITRIEEDKELKIVVAQKVVEDFIPSGESVLISDGSSTYYVADKLFEKARLQFECNNNDPFYRAHIYTNSIAIANSYAKYAHPNGSFSDVNVDIASGLFDSDLMMVGGEATNKFITMAAKKSAYSIISVRSLSAEHGPVGLEPASLSIKKSVTKSNDIKIVIVCDHKKLSAVYEKNNKPCGPLMFDTRRNWVELLNSDQLYIYSTKHPDVDYVEEIEQKPIINNTNTPMNRFLTNRRKLSDLLGDRFVEVDI